MSDTAAGVLQQQLDAMAARTSESKWLTREQTSGLQWQTRRVFAVLPFPVNRLEEFENCRGALRQCQTWLKDIEACRSQHNQTYIDATLEEYDEFFQHVEFSPLNLAQAHAMVNGEQSLLVLAGAGSGKTSVLAARVGWLLARGEATPE